jgi:hypothetical protein
VGGVDRPAFREDRGIEIMQGIDPFAFLQQLGAIGR